MSNNSTDNLLGKTKDWEENLELKIQMPVDLLRPGLDTENFKSLLTESECKIYLIVTLSVSLSFCVLSATIMMVACYKRYRETKVQDRRKRREAKELDQMSKVKSVSSFHQQKEMNGLEDQPGYPQVLIPNYPLRGGFSYTAQQNHYQQNQRISFQRISKQTSLKLAPS